MGQQQLLLIILGVIVVGIAVAVGITMFADNAVSANRDAVVNDLVNFAARAQQYYRRPTALGGGQGTFATITIDKISNKLSGSNIINANGTYSLGSLSAASMVIHGVGTEIGNDGSAPVTVEILVRSGGLSDSVYVLN